MSSLRFDYNALFQKDLYDLCRKIHLARGVLDINGFYKPRGFENEKFSGNPEDYFLI
jgi:hypothetical protein